MSLVSDARQAHIERQRRLGALPPRSVAITEESVLLRNERDGLRIQLAKANEEAADYRLTIDAQGKEIRDLREALKLKLSISDTASLDSGPVKMADILKIVAHHYKLPQSELLSHRRQLAIIRPRQICMYLAREMTIRSFPEIGRFFGGRDHTTVMHSWNRVAMLAKFDGDFSADLQILKAKVEKVKADAMAE